MIQIGEYSFSLEIFKEIVNKSISFIDVLRNLNIEYNTSRGNRVRDLIKENQINITHFTRCRKVFNERIEKIQEAIKQSSSIRETLMRLNLAPRGGNYKCIYKAIEDFNIDISHFGKKEISKENKLPIETYLKYKAPTISTSKLKEKLIDEKILERKCYNCGNTEWLGNPIPLELEHKDGNNQNSVQENLTLLCPNCHALTDTYRGKNKGKKEK